MHAPSRGRFVRRLFGAAVAIAFASELHACPAFADSWRAVYNVSLIGLSIGVADVSGRITATGYRVEARGKITGLAAVFANAKGAATGSGAISPGRIMPTTFATTAANSRMT